MAGMPYISNYERFSIKDVGKFERRLTNWCKEEYRPGRTMLIFDKSSLLVGGEPVVEEIDGVTYYKVTLNTLTLVYTTIPGTVMCIMYKIWENSTQSVMYNMPHNWDKTELWYCF